MDSRVRGNDGGEAGIRRRESDGGGGDSDLHRNGKSWKLGKRIYHSGERRNLCGDSDFHRNANAAEFCEKTLSFPRKRESIRGD